MTRFSNDTSNLDVTQAAWLLLCCFGLIDLKVIINLSAFIEVELIFVVVSVNDDVLTFAEHLHFLGKLSYFEINGLSLRFKSIYFGLVRCYGLQNLMSFDYRFLKLDTLDI